MEKVRTAIEVRYQETDQMGVVYHANYLVWFEIGRTKYVEHLGFNYNELEKNHDVVSPVIDAQISYKMPVRYGDEVFVDTWVTEYNGIRTTYGYEVVNGDGEIVVSGETKHVIVRKKDFKPLSIRKKFPDWHAAYLRQVEGE